MRAYGYRPRPPSDPHRGLPYGARAGAAPLAPDVAIDLRELAPPTRDQGALGSCTGFAGRGAVRGLIEAARRDGLWRGDAFDLSPLALYSEARFLDGTLARDEGSTLARLVEVLFTRGLPREDRWAYDPRQYLRRAPDAAWSGHYLTNATPLRHDLDDLRAALLDGCPLVVGIPCFTGDAGITGARAYAQGTIGMPRTTDDLDGWHAVTLWGHDPNVSAELGGVFYVQNSWLGWAASSNGLGTVPAEYVVRLANEIYAFGAVQ